MDTHSRGAGSSDSGYPFAREISDVASIFRIEPAKPVLSIAVYIIVAASASICCKMMENPGPRVKAVIDCSPKGRDKELVPESTDLDT